MRVKVMTQHTARALSTPLVLAASLAILLAGTVEAAPRRSITLPLVSRAPSTTNGTTGLLNQYDLRYDTQVRCGVADTWIVDTMLWQKLAARR